MVKRRAQSVESGIYPVSKAARVSGLSLHMVNYLCRHEIVTPSATPESGRGRVRYYTYTDLVVLRIVAKLLDQGISVLRFRKQYHLLKSRNVDVGQLLTHRYLVTDGSNVYLKDDRARVLERLDSGQTAFAFVMDLNPVKKAVTDSLKLGKRVG
jgi:DNA-binding transcriptional MerR regulator